MPFVTHASFGISPSGIKVGDILAQSVVSKFVTLSRAEPKEDAQVSVTVSGLYKDAIQGPVDFVMPAGQQQVRYPFTISSSGLPKNEDISVKLTFALQPDPTTSGAGVSLALSSGISFRVIDEQQEQFEIRQANFYAETDNQIQMLYTILNKGNVETRPDLIRVVLKQRDGVTQAEVIELGVSELPLTSPFTDEGVKRNFTHHLSSGNYQIESQFYKKGDLVFQSPLVPIQLVGQVPFLTKVFKDPLLLYACVGSLVLLVVMWFWIGNKNRLKS